jgi:pimeloyl-ACP methyl ester carboxylesterase
VTDVVLVHGAWHGAWCWRRVAQGLARAGHRPLSVSLGGVGERAHQPHSSVSLASHVDDVLAVIEAEELRQAVLVGHSYGGLVITGVADRLSDRDALSTLVYLDAVTPRPGERWSSTHPEATRAARREQIARTGRLAPPDAAVFGLDGADRDWVNRRMTHHPGAVYDEALDFDPARVARWPRHFIDCNHPALETIAEMRVRVRSEPGWTVHTLATGHDPTVSAPGPLTDLLIAMAAR